MRLLFWSFFIFIFIRTFIFQFYSVPTESMKETLNKGDIVMVNKLAYGPRFPMSLIGIPFTDICVEKLQLPYFRLPGFSKIKRDDIVVFNFPLDLELPVDLRQPYIKRCVAIAGDSLYILKGMLFVNDIKSKFHDKETLNPADWGAFNPKVYPNCPLIKWNLDYFGKLYVPKKGTTITLTGDNFILYKELLVRCEDLQLEKRNDSLFINGVYSPLSTYTFKMNYYFMLGDNPENSIDSRFWGFVPEDHIIGRVSQ